MPAAPLGLDDVRRARETIGGRLHRTPLLSSRTLSDRTGATVLLKAELLQRTGSFKPRGVLNKLASLSPEEKARGVISISAGNHAQALAYAAAVEGIDALVVMWETASPMKVEAARGYGASIDTSAPDIPAAFERLDRLIEETGRTLVHPFDDPAVMAGQGTVGLEIVQAVPEVDLVAVPIGGGGLIGGISAALKAARPQTRVVGVEPEGADAMTRALAAGHPVTLERMDTIADGLTAPFAGRHTLRHVQRFVDQVVTVSDVDIAAALRLIMERCKLAAEPAGAAALAGLMAGAVTPDPGSVVVCVVSGGHVDPATLKRIL